MFKQLQSQQSKESIESKDPLTKETTDSKEPLTKEQLTKEPLKESKESQTEQIQDKSDKIELLDILPFHIEIDKNDLKTNISLVRNKSTEPTKPMEPVEQYYELYKKSVKMVGLMLTLQYAIQNQQDFSNLSFTNQVYNLLLPTVLGYSFGKNITYMSMLYKVYKSFM